MQRQQPILSNIRSLTYLCLLVLLCNCTGEAQQPQTGQLRGMSVHGVRAVAQGLQNIERLYLVSVTYEETPAVHPSGTMDLAFQFQMPPANATLAARQALAATAIAALLQSYAKVNGSSPFIVNPTAAGFDVEAVATTDASGATVKQPALLDTPVSLSGSALDVSSAIGQITQQVSTASGVQLFNSNHFSRRTLPVTLNEANQPARSVLRDLLNQVQMGYATQTSTGGYINTPTTWSWHLTCDAKPTADQKAAVTQCSMLPYPVAPEGSGIVNLQASNKQ